MEVTGSIPARLKGTAPRHAWIREAIVYRPIRTSCRAFLDPYFCFTAGSLANKKLRSARPPLLVRSRCTHCRLPLGFVSPHVHIQKDKPSAERDDLDSLHLPHRLVQTRYHLCTRGLSKQATPPWRSGPWEARSAMICFLQESGTSATAEMLVCDLSRSCLGSPTARGGETCHLPAKAARSKGRDRRSGLEERCKWGAEEWPRDQSLDRHSAWTDRTRLGRDSAPSSLNERIASTALHT
jgi:hypothetical protein